MFISDQFAYLELAKTGCTQLRKVLPLVVDGKLTVGHQLAWPSLFTKQRVFLGSIRNPWEWYISLWAFGCKRLGQLYHDLCASNPDTWVKLYQNENDPQLFREWLGKMLDPNYAQDMGENYSNYPMNLFSGLMTFRYLRLFCTKVHDVDCFDRLISYGQLTAFESDKNFIQNFIRIENLEDDLFQILEMYGVFITEQKKSEIRALEKSNKSYRGLQTSQYYDVNSEQLVYEKERLIIEKFDYVAPGAKSDAF